MFTYKIEMKRCQTDEPVLEFTISSEFVETLDEILGEFESAGYKVSGTDISAEHK